MERQSDSTTWRCAADALEPGQTATFQLERNGKALRGFLVNHQGRHYAYVNRCPHAGTPLDWWPNEFFTEDGLHLICATHGAVFTPETGLCIEGPCPGARLESLSVERDGDSLVVRCRK
ncbi:MAG TPA: Rieske (2Fe-2S) protein [Methylomirabilota bacterium]|nr:Rieske (2Fe-2S) protein [Methylomirabilota bacterium]